MSTDPTNLLDRGSACIADDRNARVSGYCFSRRGPQFAPPRKGNSAKAFTSGRAAMKAMADAIKSAQKFILITDWQMNFDVELDNRGDPDHPDRLSELLFHAMVRGVDVRVLLYDSVEAAAYTHENENVQKLYEVQQRLPDNALGSIQVALQNPASGREDYTNIFFSHHQKMLLVDGETAFLGGLDFAHGRWDDGNFDVVCDPRVHVINDHYNNCVSSGRQASGEEGLLTEVGLGRNLNDRPGFANAYLPGLAVAIDRLQQMWNDGALLSEVISYVDKAGVDEIVWGELVKVLADVPIPGYSEAAAIVEKLGELLDSIQRFAREADQKYDAVISAQVRAVDEAAQGDIDAAAHYQLQAFRELVPNPVTFFKDKIKELKEKAANALALIEEYGPVVLDKASEYAQDPRQVIADIQALLEQARQAYERFVNWLNTPVDRSQWLLDSSMQPRMPWQDIHLMLQGPATFDVFRNFAYRWNATVLQNKSASSYATSLLWVANKVGGLSDAIPEQKQATRGTELSMMDAEWLQEMGGRESLFGNIDAAGTAGNTTVQILRSSGSALHTLENQATQKSSLNTRHANVPAGAPELPAGAPLQNILDAMLNCIGSARAYIYIETQFLMSDCGWSDGEGGTKLAAILRGDGSQRDLTLTEKGVDAAAGVAAGRIDAALPGDPMDALLRERPGEASPAKNRIVEALAERIGAAIDAGRRFTSTSCCPSTRKAASSTARWSSSSTGSSRACCAGATA